MSDLLKAMADLEGLTKAVEPSASVVAKALGELESATWCLQKAMTPRAYTAPKTTLPVSKDASTSMAKSAAAEASAYVHQAWAQYRDNH